MRKSYFMQKWANFREISQNFVARNFREIFAKTKNFTNVFAKSKNITKFDSDTACMVGVNFCLQNITFWKNKKNICIVIFEFRCHYGETKIFVFAFCAKIFAKKFFTKNGEISGNINDADYLGNGAFDWIMFTKEGIILCITKNLTHVFRKVKCVNRFCIFAKISNIFVNFHKKLTRKCENENVHFNPTYCTIKLLFRPITSNKEHFLHVHIIIECREEALHSAQFNLSVDFFAKFSSWVGQKFWNNLQQDFKEEFSLEHIFCQNPQLRFL
jgi:hypothetical protein